MHLRSNHGEERILYFLILVFFFLVVVVSFDSEKQPKSDQMKILLYLEDCSVSS